MSADITLLSDAQAQKVRDLDPLKKTIVARFERYARLSGWPPKTSKASTQPPALADILGWFSAFEIGQFADTIATHAPLQLAQKQEVLEMLDARKRLECVEAATRELDKP